MMARDDFKLDVKEILARLPAFKPLKFGIGELSMMNVSASDR